MINPQHRRQQDETSSGSVNQEMIMDEAKRQVTLAMHGRDQEVVSLRQRNKELEHALAS